MSKFGLLRKRNGADSTAQRPAEFYERSEKSATPGSALTAGGFFLRRQEKVTKKKATPGSAVGYADFPALLVQPGGCATRPCGAQTVLADFPRLAYVARRSTGGTAFVLNLLSKKLRSASNAIALTV